MRNGAWGGAGRSGDHSRGGEMISDGHCIRREVSDHYPHGWFVKVRVKISLDSAAVYLPFPPAPAASREWRAYREPRAPGGCRSGENGNPTFKGLRGNPEHLRERPWPRLTAIIAVVAAPTTGIAASIRRLPKLDPGSRRDDAPFERSLMRLVPVVANPAVDHQRHPQFRCRRHQARGVRQQGVDEAGVGLEHQFVVHLQDHLCST